jgi:plasmid stabilization system protein ParE
MQSRMFSRFGSMFRSVAPTLRTASLPASIARSIKSKGTLSGGERIPEGGGVLRRVISDKYLVFYEVRANDIAIVRIMHAARNWQELL